MIKKISFLAAIGIFIALGMGRASAAAFNFALDKQSFAIGDDFTVHLHIDSQGIAVNAAQGTILYPSDILEVKNIDKATSVFNFWLQDPTVSSGRISFTGGSTSGFSGTSLDVFHVTFHVKGTGNGSLTVADGAITASDGSGTNVLVGGKGIEIASSSGQAGTSTQVTVTAPIIPPITPIVRTAVPSQKLPAKPELLIGLYPDEAAWNEASSPFLVQWNLPSDVTNVATSVTKDPTAAPVKGEGLFDNKTFAPLDNGIWYLHTQFKNNIGWGPVAHYRIAIDAVPPLPFDINFLEGAAFTNPQPTVSFMTSDQPSGVNNYTMQLDGGDAVSVEEGSTKIPLQLPGKHTIRVIAHDRAGNTTETSAEFEVIPIASPEISSISKSVFVGEGGFEIRGTSVAGYSVTISLKDIKGGVISSIIVPVDSRGDWFAKMDDPLKRGKYYAEVTARDERGALSLPVKSDTISAETKPILTFAGLGITSGGLFAIIVLVLLMGFAAGWFLNRKAGEQRQRKIAIAKRDIINVFNLIKKDLKSASDAAEKSADKAPEAGYHIEKARKDMEKMEKYLVEGVEEIDKKK